MGNPIEPPEYGDDCDDCFAPGETPAKVILNFTGVKIKPGKDPEPGHSPNGVFILTGGFQGYPCRYYFENGYYRVYFSFVGPTLKTDIILDIWIHTYFWARNLPMCGNYAVNDPTGEQADGGYDGHCQVTWAEPTPGPSASLAASLAGVPVDENTMFEPFPIDVDYHSFRLANVKYSSNVLLKIES